MKKIILVITMMLAMIASANALRQVVGPIEINSCPGKLNHGIYGLISDLNSTQRIVLKAEGDVADYLLFPPEFILQPGIVNYVVVFDKISKEDNLYGKTLSGYIIASEKAETCSGCAKVNVELKKPITINVCQKNFMFKFFDFFKKIFSKNEKEVTK